MVSLTTKAKEEALTKRYGLGQTESRQALYIIMILKQSSLKKYIQNLNGSYNEDRLCNLTVVGLIEGSKDAYTRTGIGTHIHSNSYSQ